MAALETGTASGPVEGEASPLSNKLEEALERIADLEGGKPGGYIGGVPRTLQERQGRSSSVMDSEAIVALGPATDDKNAVWQWDLKLINVLNKIQPRYGVALERLKQGIDRGEDLEDARPGGREAEEHEGCWNG